MIEALKLNESGINKAQLQAQAIADSATQTISSKQFVYFAAFDGTNNDRANLNLSGNPLDTNVAQLAGEIKQSENVVVGYFPGPGTGGTLTASSWLAPQVTRQVLDTAQAAYNDFAAQASAWLESHPGQSVTTAITGFSRGGVTAAVFSQLVFENGLIDPVTKKVLIPPGAISVSAGVIFDPVGTGVNGNLNFAPNVKNVTVIRAENEYRYLFEAANYEGSRGVQTLTMTGNHCDIGGGYDQGLGALTLAAATKYFANSGLALEPVSPSRQFEAKDATIHDEGWNDEGGVRREVWSTYYSIETDIPGPRLTDERVVPPIVDLSDAHAEVTTFVDAFGREVTYRRQFDNYGEFSQSTTRITTKDGLYQQHSYDKNYFEIEHSWNDSIGSYQEFYNQDGSHSFFYSYKAGGYRAERLDARGGIDLDYRNADGSGEEIHNHDDSTYHATYGSNGEIDLVFADSTSHGTYSDDGLGNILSDTYSENGEEQHYRERADGSSFTETLHNDGSIDRYTQDSNGTFVELHSHTDGSVEQITYGADGSIETLYIESDGSSSKYYTDKDGHQIDTFINTEGETEIYQYVFGTDGIKHTIATTIDSSGFTRSIIDSYKSGNGEEFQDISKFEPNNNSQDQSHWIRHTDGTSHFYETITTNTGTKSIETEYHDKSRKLYDSHVVYTDTIQGYSETTIHADAHGRTEVSHQVVPLDLILDSYLSIIDGNEYSNSKWQYIDGSTKEITRVADASGHGYVDEVTIIGSTSTQTHTEF